MNDNNGAGVIEGKVCGKCKEWKLREAFYPNKQRPDGLQAWCKECYRIWFQKKRHNDLDWYKARIKQSSKHLKQKLRTDHEWRKKETERMRVSRKSRWLRCITAYGGRCQRCGEFPRGDKYGAASMQFHHIDPDKKKKQGSYAVQRLDFDELDKCCLLCANCHAVVTSREIEVTYTPRAGGQGYTIKEWWWTEDSWFYEGGTRHPGAAFK